MSEPIELRRATIEEICDELDNRMGTVVLVGNTGAWTYEHSQGDATDLHFMLMRMAHKIMAQHLAEPPDNSQPQPETTSGVSA